MAIDAAYAAEWWNMRNPDKPTLHTEYSKRVLPIKKAIRGHPEAGPLLEKHIVRILTQKLNQKGYKPTTDVVQVKNKSGTIQK